MRLDWLIVIFGSGAAVLHMTFPPKIVVADGGERVQPFTGELARLAVTNTSLLALHLASIAIITFGLWFVAREFENTPK